MSDEVNEPVAWMRKEDDRLAKIVFDKQTLIRYAGGTDNWTPLYTAPPQRPLLTDEEIWDLFNDTSSYVSFARAIERKVRGEE